MEQIDMQSMAYYNNWGADDQLYWNIFLSFIIFLVKIESFEFSWLLECGHL